jgi:hypothetical protein
MMKKLLLTACIFLSLTVLSQSTYTWSGPNNGSWVTATNWTPNRNTPATNDILQFNDGTTKTITSVPTQTIGRLSVFNNTSITLNAASSNRTVTIGNITGDDLIILAGSSLTIGTGTSFIISVTNNATADISGILNITSGRTYATNTSGTTTTVSGTGVIDNSGTVNSTSTARLVFAAGADYEHDQNGGTIPTATWSTTANCNVTGITGTVPAGLNQSFGNFTWDCAGQTASVNFNGNFTDVNGDLNIANTNGSSRHVLLGNSNTTTLDIDGDLTIGSTGNTAVLDMDATNGVITINLNGDLTTIASGQIDNTGTNNATFNFNNLSATQNINLGNSTSFAANWGGNINIGTGSSTNKVVLQTNLALASTFHTNIVVLNGSTFDMGNFVISNIGRFTSNSGSILGIGHAGGISSSGSTGNIQVSNTRTFSTTSDYAYTGSAGQITGNGLPATVNRLTIDNASGVNTGVGVVLSQATTVTTELVLTNSYLKTTSTNILTLNTGAIATHTNNSFVAGPMRKIGNTTFQFPTGWAGTGGGRVPIQISSLSASATVQAEYKRGGAGAGGTTITAPLHHISGCEYWELFPTSGSVTGTVTMYWTAYSNCSPVSYVTNFATLVVARSNGTAWTSQGNTGGSMGSGLVISNAAITINNTTPFKFFSLGSTSASTNPLPILLDNVKAYEKNNGVQVEWSNLTEKDVYNYIVQRSANGRDFTEISYQWPKNNMDDRADYTAFDANPIRGANYYRIKATEITGKELYSKTLRVEIGNTRQTITLYPNPVTGHQFTLALNGIRQGNYSLTIINNSGQKVYQTMIQSGSTSVTQSLQLPLSITPGIYTALISGNEFIDNKLFIVQ